MDAITIQLAIRCDAASWRRVAVAMQQHLSTPCISLIEEVSEQIQDRDARLKVLTTELLEGRGAVLVCPLDQWEEVRTSLDATAQANAVTMTTLTARTDDEDSPSFQGLLRSAPLPRDRLICVDFSAYWDITKDEYEVPDFWVKRHGSSTLGKDCSDVLNALEKTSSNTTLDNRGNLIMIVPPRLMEAMQYIGKLDYSDLARMMPEGEQVPRELRGVWTAIMAVRGNGPCVVNLC